MIKVITGIRRCGKSCLMQCIAEELRAEGLDDERIVFFDLDRYGYRFVKTHGVPSCPRVPSSACLCPSKVISWQVGGSCLASWILQGVKRKEGAGHMAHPLFVRAYQPGRLRRSAPWGLSLR